MNVLVVCNKFPYPPTDGGQIATFSMIRGMAELEHSVTVAAINTSKHYFDVTKLPEAVKQIADFQSVFVNTDLTAKDALCNLLFSRLPYTATRFVVDDFFILLRRIFSEKTFDIVQLEGLYMCAYIPLIRQCSKAKIVYRAHNVEFEIWQRLAKETKGNFFKKFYLNNLAKRVERFEKSMLNQYDFIVPITKRDCELYTKIGNQKPSLVAPTGIFVKDLPKFQPAHQETISLFHLGALDWTPNQQGLIWFLENCWQQIRIQHPEIQLFVAGRNAPGWFVEKLNIPGVVYMGEVPNAYEFMSQHTIMIVPLLAGGGMRIKILEGLSYGKIIVSTSIGAEGIPAENEKEICIADTPAEFIATIEKLLKNNELIVSVGNCAKQFVCEKFDNNLIIDKLLNFYKD